jgi:hypothetical protein
VGESTQSAHSDKIKRAGGVHDGTFIVVVLESMVLVQGEDKAMRLSVRNLVDVAAIAAAGLIAAGGAARAETWKLELKRLEPVSDAGVFANPPADWVYREVASQGAFFDLTGKSPNSNAQAFAKIVKKEPAKYQSERPLRGVFKLGSDQYAFVLDMKDAKSKVYDVLYFDVNHNGDLIDDKIIDGATTSGFGLFFGGGSRETVFPRVDLTVNVEGAKSDYSFFLRATSWPGPRQSRSVQVSLTAAAYRVGEITLDGKKHKIALLDFNSNGRFDDAAKVPDKAGTPDGEIEPMPGDALLVDPQNAKPPEDIFWEPFVEHQQWVSKLARIDDRFYDLKITPAGDQITLTPSSVPLGYLASANEGLTALMWSEIGLLQVVKGKSKPVAVPEGKCRLMSYTMGIKQEKKPAVPPEKRKEAAEKKPAGKEKPSAGKEGAEKEPPKTSLLGAIARVVFGVSGPEDELRMGPAGYSMVNAQATKECKPVTVRKGQTVTLPFGPPYKPVVTASHDVRASGHASLSFSLLGSGGETVNYMLVDGRRPPAPQFTISTVKGEVVQEGRFEYG